MRPVLFALGAFAYAGGGCADLIGIHGDQQPLAIDHIEVSVGTLSPAFDPEISDYQLQLAFGDDWLELHASSNDPVAEVLIADQPATGAPVDVDVAIGDATIEIVGRSPTGVTATYRVHVHRPDLAIAFAAPETIQTPLGMIQRVDFADFDGNGAPDLGAVSITGDIGIFTNNGAGQMISHGSMQFGGARSFTTCDIDHDGHPELIVNANQVWIAHGYGNGTFDPGGGACPTAVASSFAFANIDPEPTLDLVIAETSGAIRVCTGTPAGAFGLAPGFDQAIGPDERIVVAGPVDPMPGDDLVSLDIPARTITLHHNKGSSFDPKPLQLASGAQPVEIGLFDLDGDGFAEVVWIDRSTDSVIVTDGAGTVKVSRHVEGHPRSLTIADVDGDGHADVTVLTDGGLAILHSDGCCDLDLKTIAMSLPGVAHIALADFDHDGRIDLATANFTDRISIQRGKP